MVSQVCQPLNVGMLNNVIIMTVYQMAIRQTSFHCSCLTVTETFHLQDTELFSKGCIFI